MYIYVWRDKHVHRSLKNYQQHENNGQNSKVRFPHFLHRNGRHLGRVAKGKKNLHALKNFNLETPF